MYPKSEKAHLLIAINCRVIQQKNVGSIEDAFYYCVSLVNIEIPVNCGGT